MRTSDDKNQLIHKASDLLQVVSDGLNINLLFLKYCREKRSLNQLPALLDCLPFWILERVVLTLFMEV